MGQNRNSEILVKQFESLSLLPLCAIWEKGHIQFQAFNSTRSVILEKLDRFHCIMQCSVSRNCIEKTFYRQNGGEKQIYFPIVL